MTKFDKLVAGVNPKARLPRHFYLWSTKMQIMWLKQNLFQLAQEVTDKVLGPGTYKKMNKFDPSKGETHQRDSVGCFHQLEHIDEPPFRYRCKLCGKRFTGRVYQVQGGFMSERDDKLEMYEKEQNMTPTTKQTATCPYCDCSFSKSKLTKHRTSCPQQDNEVVDLKTILACDDLAMPEISEHIGLVSGKTLIEYVQESIHGNWEGFTKSEQLTIRKVLSDLIRRSDGLNNPV